jgi:predicted Zn-dependent protease
MVRSRIEALRRLLDENPGDSMTRYMLAIELHKAGAFQECIDEMEAYLKAREDEGAAYRILADAYLQLGKKKEGAWAFRQGAEAARRHHHDGMAEEFEERLKEL